MCPWDISNLGGFQIVIETTLNFKGPEKNICSSQRLRRETFCRVRSWDNRGEYSTSLKRDPGNFRKAWKYDEPQMSINQKGKGGNLKNLGKKNILDYPEQKVHFIIYWQTQAGLQVSAFQRNGWRSLCCQQFWHRMDERKYCFPFS